MKVSLKYPGVTGGSGVPGGPWCPWWILLNRIPGGTLVFLEDPSVLLDHGVSGASKCPWRAKVFLVDGGHCRTWWSLDPNVPGG